jgi:hypothetical protein
MNDASMVEARNKNPHVSGVNVPLSASWCTLVQDVRTFFLDKLREEELSGIVMD